MFTFFQNIKPIILIIHAISAAVALGGTLVGDIFFFHFARNYTISAYEERILRILSGVLWFALVGLIISGVGLYLSAPDVYNESAKFISKMVLVIIVILNGIVLNVLVTPRLKMIAFDKELDREHHIAWLRQLAYASGFISLSTWLIIFILGSVATIPVTVGVFLLGYIIFEIIGIIGSQIFAYVIAQRHTRERKG